MYKSSLKHHIQRHIYRYMCVCIYVYIYLYMHTHTPMYTHMCI